MRRYSKEFKEEALKLSDEIGVKKHQNSQVFSNIQYPAGEETIKEESLKPKLTDDEIRLRISELERENTELKKANDILKDALGFFAKDWKK